MDGCTGRVKRYEKRAARVREMARAKSRDVTDEDRQTPAWVRDAGVDRCGKREKERDLAERRWIGRK